MVTINRWLAVLVTADSRLAITDRYRFTDGNLQRRNPYNSTVLFANSFRTRLNHCLLIPTKFASIGWRRPIAGVGRVE